MAQATVIRGAGKLDRRGRTSGPAVCLVCRTLPIVAHGLSLSLGDPGPLDESFLGRVADFLRQHHIPLYTEHLSYCSAEGYL